MNQQRNDLNQKWKSIPIFLRVIICLLPFWIIGIFTKDDKPKISDEQKPLNSVITENNKNMPNKVKTTNWIYDTTFNAMDDSKTTIATIKAVNIEEFGFPYNGGSTFQLTLRKQGKNTDVYLRVSKGQFMSAYTNGIIVRFGDNKPIKFSYNEPADGSSDLIFINNESRFINELKKSNYIKIEVTFFNEGNRILQFFTEGLNW